MMVQAGEVMTNQKIPLSRTNISFSCLSSTGGEGQGGGGIFLLLLVAPCQRRRGD